MKDEGKEKWDIRKLVTGNLSSLRIPLLLLFSAVSNPESYLV